MPMNAHLLSLILYLQSFKEVCHNKNILFGTQEDVFSLTLEEYNRIPAQIFSAAGIKRNRFNLERILHFVVTEEIMEMEDYQLEAVSVPFMPKDREE